MFCYTYYMTTNLDDVLSVYRPEDGELMGLIYQDSSKDDSWQPLTTFGYPLADYMAKRDATHYLQLHGLEVLLDGWQFLDLTDQEWYNCTIVEAKPKQLVIRISDYGHPEVHQLRTVSDPIQQNIRHH